MPFNPLCEGDSCASCDFVIFLSQQDWERFHRRYPIEVLAERLPGSKILCVERPVCLLSTPIRNTRRFLNWISQKGNLREEKGNLFIFRPFVPVHDFLASKLPLLPVVNRRLLSTQLKRVMERLGLRKDNLIAWIYSPFQREYLRLVNEKLSVYECYDDYSALPEIPFLKTRKDLIARERKVLEDVDLVFVVSEMLFNSKRKFHRNVHIVPNAADVRHFMLASAADTPVAPDIAGIAHPIMGFVGNLTGRIDFRLLKYLADTHPEWSLVLVGGFAGVWKELARSREVSGLRQKDNVYFMGPRPYQELPSYLKAFDVCLIPYTGDSFNIHSSPLKVYEYLATGKPTVSTRLPAVEMFREVIKLAWDHVEFERCVAEAIAERDDGLRQRRIEVASENSWADRASDMIDILDH